MGGRGSNFLLNAQLQRHRKQKNYFGSGSIKQGEKQTCEDSRPVPNGQKF